jgi:hypothetical protein
MSERDWFSTHGTVGVHASDMGNVFVSFAPVTESQRPKRGLKPAEARAMAEALTVAARYAEANR